MAKPGLWISLNALRTGVSDPTWERGLALYRQQAVLDFDIEPLDDHWQVFGVVQGSLREPYELSIEVLVDADGEPDRWISDCSCPVGHQCKHGVAVMLRAAHEGVQFLADHSMVAADGSEQQQARRKAEQERLAEMERARAERELLHWLHKLDRAEGKSKAPVDGTPSQRADQVLYLLGMARTDSPRDAMPTLPRLRLRALLAYTKVAGGWSKPKPLRDMPMPGQPIYEQASEADLAALQLMNGLLHYGDASVGYYHSYSLGAGVMLQGPAGPLALQQAASTGRLFLDAGDGQPGAPLQWGPPETIEWRWDELPAGATGEPQWALRARLTKDSALLCSNNPPLYLDVPRGLCGTVSAQGIPCAQLTALLQAPALPTSALEKHQPELVQRLGCVPMPPVLKQYSVLEGVAPRALLHLSLTPAQQVEQQGLLCAQLSFDYQGVRGWWAGQGDAVMADGPQGRVLLRRDPEAEFEAVQRLFALGLSAQADSGRFGLPGGASQQPWLQWYDHGFAVLRDAGFELTQDAALNDWIAHAQALDVRLQPKTEPGAEQQNEASSGLEDSGAQGTSSPWFDLSLGIEVNGQRHNILPLLPDLIAAASASARTAGDGSPELPPFLYLKALDQAGYVRVPSDALKPWMAALLELVGDRSHDFSGDSLQISRVEALRASAALGEGVAWQGAELLRATVLQLGHMDQLPEVPVPASVQADLRPYQRQGLNWLQFLRAHHLGGVLADDMGLGKTLQTLAHIQLEKDAGRLDHPALIIAPVSLMGNWQREAARFCPQLRCLVLHGKERHAVADSMAEHDLVIAPYSLLQRDRERWLAANWHLVVLDEAQNIKNASTHAAQVVSQLQARHRLCLSGTPIENHLGEIWSLFHFLMPGFLGSQRRFGELFRNPIEKQGDPERLAQLRARVTPFILRRTKALVAHELPPKVETVMRIELTGKQADLYETIRLGMEKAVREALQAKGLAKSQITILDALLKLRQVCCSPALLKLEAAHNVKESAKLAYLMEVLPEMLAEGRRILLFSQFTSMLTQIETELKKRQLRWVKLTGQSHKRDALIEQFTSGQVPLFLISLKAGGVGLNLPQADTVIHYDPWWNPAAEAQATDRAHRIGQTQSVWVVKLVAQGTIEERILALQERKAQLADSLYSAAHARREPMFTESDLAELLKPLSGD